ncbi:MAG TPA: hypothetical protein VHB21_02880, partial [Minicystis sp.]|nr:hypothetical protein [Minicystis sp.]
LAALAGAAAWIAWNAHAHGDPLHFVARVTAFARATAAVAGGPPRVGPAAYAVALLTDTPAVTAACVAAWAWAFFARARADVRAQARRWVRPLAVACAGLVAVAAAGLRDAAPTHHPERVLLLLTLTLVVSAVDVAGFLAARTELDRGLGPALAALGVALAVLSPRGDFTDRAEEEWAGAAAASMSRPGDRVLVDVVDFGFLAAIAAYGRPEDALADRSVDPRGQIATSSFADAAALAARIEALRPALVAGRIDSAAPSLLGPPAAFGSTWAVWRVRAPSP